ncbi:MAG: hypothetical protein ABL977_04175, partial [Candidatus Eisenbacteria bacterium]
MRSPLMYARLALAACLFAISVPFALAAPAKPTMALPPDNAPFWTGNPDAPQFKARIQRRLALAQGALDKMLAVKGPRTIANTLAPFDEVQRQLDMAGSQSGLVEETNPDSALRATAEELSQEISKFVTDLSLNRAIYDALAGMNLTGADAETKYYVEKTLRDFKLSGVDKDEATRNKIKKTQEELVLISQEFGRNIREDKSSITCTVAELDGLPQDFIDR